jgi:1-phosphofructokinase
MIATLTLNPSVDRNIIVDNLGKDDTNRALGFWDTAGGKGLNVSKVVKELGGRTAAFSFAGGAVGRYWLELAGRIGVSLKITPVRGMTRLNIVLTDRDDHTQTRVSLPGPVVLASELERLKKALFRLRPKPAFCVLGGSLSRGMKVSTYRTLIAEFEKRGVSCVLDADGAALKEGIRAVPFMVKPNEHEMERLFGRRMNSLKDYLRAAQTLVERGVGLVVVSLGKRGALFADPKEAFHVSTPVVTVKSKIGAGDSLIGGVLVGLERGMPLERAARLGVAASTSAVMREAPRLCRRSDIPGLLRRVRIRRIS